MGKHSPDPLNDYEKNHLILLEQYNRVTSQVIRKIRECAAVCPVKLRDAFLEELQGQREIIERDWLKEENSKAKD